MLQAVGHHQAEQPDHRQQQHRRQHVHAEAHQPDQRRRERVLTGVEGVDQQQIDRGERQADQIQPQRSGGDRGVLRGEGAVLKQHRDDRRRQHEQADAGGQDEHDRQAQPQAERIAEGVRAAGLWRAQAGGGIVRADLRRLQRDQRGEARQRRQDGDTDGRGHQPLRKLDQRGGPVHVPERAIDGIAGEVVAERAHHQRVNHQREHHRGVQPRDLAHRRMPPVERGTQRSPAQARQQQRELRD